MKMNRIIMHHTAGRHIANTTDRKHYHRITQGDGSVVEGVHPISHNAPGKPLVSGRYAAHVAGLNTGSIGCSVAAMHGAVWGNPRACEAFPTRIQMDAFVADVAAIAAQFSIPVMRQTILTHAEVEITLGVKQAGKWDFDYDPFGEMDTRDPIKIGDMLRTKIAIVLGDEVNTLIAPRGPDRVLRRGSIGPDVAWAQRTLGITDDGIFGPATWAAVAAFQKSKQLAADGVVGRMTWAALRE